MANIRRYFFTGDTHFSHRNVIKYCNRPFASADEMNEQIVENWNKTVTKSDIVYHLGDVAFEKDNSKRNAILHRLNGEKHLIWGNHDKGLKTTGWQQFFHSAADLRAIYVPPESAGNKTGQRIVLCHYAMRVWDQSHYGTWQLYGHSHGTLPEDNNSLQCDVGVDAWDFTPVSMEQLTAIMRRKNFTPIDHHRGKDESEDVFIKR